jgi:hypothetical protein
VTAREADIFRCLVETVVAPAGAMPPVARTDAVAFLDRYLRDSPAPNRAGLRALLHAVEVGPRALGFRGRMRQLAPEARVRYLRALERGRTGAAFQLLEAVAKLAYYGDDGAMRSLGYDPDAVVARGRELRARELRW